MRELRIPAMPELWQLDTMPVYSGSLLGALAKWAVRQSPYAAPDDLEIAIHEFAEGWPHADATKMSSRALIAVILEVFDRCKIILSWNSPKIGNPTMGVVSLYDKPVPDHDFIDLFALARNMVHDIVLDERIQRAQAR